MRLVPPWGDGSRPEFRLYVQHPTPEFQTRHQPVADDG